MNETTEVREMPRMIPVHEQRVVQTSFVRSAHEFEQLRNYLEQEGFAVRHYGVGMNMYSGKFEGCDAQIYVDNIELHLDSGLNFRGKRYSPVDSQSQAVLGGLVSVPEGENAELRAEERRISLSALLERVALLIEN